MASKIKLLNGYLMKLEDLINEVTRVDDGNWIIETLIVELEDLSKILTTQNLTYNT